MNILWWNVNITSLLGNRTFDHGWQNKTKLNRLCNTPTIVNLQQFENIFLFLYNLFENFKNVNPYKAFISEFNVGIELIQKCYVIKLTVVQYSCIGCVILWFLYLPPFPAKKQSWHISKLKHLRQRYLKCVKWHLEDFYINIYSLPKPKDWILLANIAFCLMLCGLSSSESTTRFHQQNSLASKSSQFLIIIPVEHWQPNHTLRLLLHPTQEMESLKKDLLEFPQEHKTGI